MATVRIYKVAELLGTTSQEVMALLKRDHGIEVKSASSTIEEVVARQFVERLARQRNIPVPSSAAYADTPAPVRGRKPAGKAPEPQRPPAAALPPPPRAAGLGVSANDALVGTLMFRWRACLVTNSRATTSSIVLDALFTSMPWSFFRSAMTSWLERLRSSATL